MILTKYRRKPGWKTVGVSPAAKDFKRRWMSAIRALRSGMDPERQYIPQLLQDELSRMLTDTLTRAVARGGREGQQDVRNAYKGLHKAEAATVESAAQNFSFTLTNPQVSTWIEQNTGKLITAISEEQRQAVTTIIGNSYMWGLSPADTGKLIQQSVGLTGRWATALGSYQSGLMSGGTSGALLDKLVGRYSDQLLSARGEMIARTEILGAENAGRAAAWDEAQSMGLISADTHLQEWQATADERECDECDALDGEQVGLDEEFPDGEPPVHPDCRCTVVLVETGDPPTDAMANTVEAQSLMEDLTGVAPEYTLPGDLQGAISGMQLVDPSVAPGLLDGGAEVGDTTYSGPLYHGTSGDVADAIMQSGFEPTTYTPWQEVSFATDPSSAASYAERRGEGQVVQLAATDLRLGSLEDVNAVYEDVKAALKAERGMTGYLETVDSGELAQLTSQRLAEAGIDGYVSSSSDIAVTNMDLLNAADHASVSTLDTVAFVQDAGYTDLPSYMADKGLSQDTLQSILDSHGETVDQWWGAKGVEEKAQWVQQLGVNTPEDAAKLLKDTLEQASNAERTVAELPAPNYGLEHSADKFYSEIDTNRLTEKYTGWVDDLTPTEQAAVNDYTTVSGDINVPTRLGEALDPASELQRTVLDSALEKASAPSDLSVWRVADKDFLPTMEKGTTWTDRGFVSTSTMESVAEDFESLTGESVKLQILVPEGYQAAYLAGVPGNSYVFQQELLLRRDTTFRVLRYLPRDEVWVVEVIP